jgi:protein-tyrosine-phosphatase
MHAALGEPVRLAIADTLSLRDVAPKALAAAFDLPTNLLAHHLSVMEEAGLLLRRRSEGDRRRTYVHLRVEDPDVRSLVGAGVLDPAVATPRVVFVCTHNSARSQLAAAEWQRLSTVPAASAGTHPAERVHRRAIETGRLHKLRLGRSHTRHIDDVLSDDDLVVAVCDQAHEEMAAGGRIRNELHWSIPDPVRIETDQAFEDAFIEISYRVHRLAGAIGTPT